MCLYCLSPPECLRHRLRNSFPEIDIGWHRQGAPTEDGRRGPSSTRRPIQPHNVAMKMQQSSSKYHTPVEASFSSCRNHSGFWSKRAASKQRGSNAKGKVKNAHKEPMFGTHRPPRLGQLREGRKTIYAPSLSGDEGSRGGGHRRGDAGEGPKDDRGEKGPGGRGVPHAGIKPRGLRLEAGFKPWLPSQENLARRR